VNVWVNVPATANSSNSSSSSRTPRCGRVSSSSFACSAVFVSAGLEVDADAEDILLVSGLCKRVVSSGREKFLIPNHSSQRLQSLKGLNT
jgi:hypothetical protein